MTTVESAPETKGTLDRVAVFLATGFSLSILPLALMRRVPANRLDISKWSGCGLVGSALGTGTFLLLPQPWASSPLLLVLGTLAAVGISGRAERVLGKHDDSRIVIDEWIGAWIAAAAAPHAWGMPLIASFVLFRIFDVIKGPFAPLQRLPRGWGVTMDDVAAGIAAFLIIRYAPFFH
jgi:phosphatidylglycerophosphatase A